MKKRFAAHLVVIGKNRFKQYVVETEGKRVLRIFPLTEELAFTEWIGGVILLSSDKNRIEQTPLPISLDSLLELFVEDILPTPQPGEEYPLPNRPLYAWHISAAAVSANLIPSLRQL